ncbi:MAG: site-specific integrase [Ignavibacteriales bacterium]|nr:site-specific integrase [Ignavibacteriales bacterium]
MSVINESNQSLDDQIKLPLLAEFIEKLRLKKHTQGTLQAYQSDLIKFSHYLSGIDIGSSEESALNVTPQHIESYIQKFIQTGSKFSTIRRTLIVIKTYFDYLLGKKVVISNPAASIKFFPVYNDILDEEKILSMLQYLIAHQQTDNQSLLIRYKRDELILMFMLLYGVRQYHIPILRLSSIQQNGQSVIINVNDNFSFKLSGAMLLQLHDYLSSRNTNADRIFHDPLSGKPISISCNRILLQELNYALHLDCTPLVLHHTHLYLKNRHGLMNELLQKISYLHSQATDHSKYLIQGVSTYA